MPQIANRPRTPLAPSPAPLAVVPRTAQAKRAAHRAPPVDAEPVYQEPAMRSPMLPLLWLVVPFVATLIVGVLTS